MAEKVFLKECYIQGTNQYDALDVWNRIDIGSQLSLKYEDEKVFLYSGESLYITKYVEFTINDDNKFAVNVNLNEATNGDNSESKLVGTVSISGEVKPEDSLLKGAKATADVKILINKANKDDKGNAVANKIGFLSDEDAKDLTAYMNANQEGIFDACISYKDKEGKADENKRLKVVIRVFKK